MRIVHVDNLQIRRYGRAKVSTGRKLMYGMVRNNYKVCEFSERDIARFEAPLKIKPLGVRIANRRLIETCDNFHPDLVLMGHCDLIENGTLREIRRLLPSVRIAYRNVDPPWEERNIERVRRRMEAADAIFMTTGGDFLRQFCTGKNRVAWMPNPCDPAVEDQNNAEKTAFDRDLVFCGVGQPTDERYPFIEQLHDELKGRLKFESFGMHGHPAVWGRDYDDVIAGSRMGLNLDRFRGHELYSSARISQLMGNGLLTVLWERTDLKRFIDDGMALYFRDMDDLVAKLNHYRKHDEERRAVAARGRDFYQRAFSGRAVSRFMVETTLTGEAGDAPWADQIYP
ncbi:glycosyltransferase [Kiritimatiella glycovorans]|uniref:Spore protein YkvP/CgeB glycosyl transferase-like domain-containing protein n=1 Tax=Kiritimatiella glycovorans TaxID=1307763 RepID=A0A0G3EDB0_9BACT|nr:glycosyltransferase [Kiritimatiella glycovorans]AKJ64446.1 hypothetical protein L21SP4_01198 [Kiritimatiella glycovorans]